MNKSLSDGVVITELDDTRANKTVTLTLEVTHLCSGFDKGNTDIFRSVGSRR